MTRSRFATLDDPGTPVRVVLVGAGLMGQAWLRTLAASADVMVVGVVDLDPELARTAANDAGVEVETGTDLLAVAAATKAQAVVNATVPQAHLQVDATALFAGLPVLTEKPLAPTVAEALVAAAAAETAGQLLMTSQNRRYYTTLAAYRQVLGDIGPVALLTTEFAREAHFPGFRETMAHPLLVDMAIHPFDVARYLVGADPVSVVCNTSNPPWSWFAGDSIANALFEFPSGLRYRYTGTWSTRGLKTSWNGSWRASGERGTATWDGEGTPRYERVDPETGTASTGTAPVGADAPEEIAGSLADFVDCLRTGRVPESEVHHNVHSLAMVEAAVRSADTGQRVRLDAVLEDAYAEALAMTWPPAVPGQVRETLRAWGSAAAGLAAG